MKKIIISLLMIFGFTSLYANKLGCVPLYIQKGEIKYKYSEKEQMDNIVVITINDQILSDGHSKYKYFITIDNIDYYENKKNNLVIGITSQPGKNGAYGALITSGKADDKQTIYLLCLDKKHLKK